MNEQQLIRMLGSRASKTAHRRWTCPSDIQVASYLDGHLAPAERLRFEEHLADCGFCLELVADHFRQNESSEPITPPPDLLRQAIEAVPVKSRWGVSLTKWAVVPVVASIVVAGGLLLRSPQARRMITSQAAQSGAGPSSSERPSREPADIRSFRSPAPGLEVLEPRPESVIQRKDLRFRWKSLANTAYYEIRVVNSEGDVVWQAQESNPVAQVPPHVLIQPGKYFVWVRAYLKDGRTVKSEAMAFIVAVPK